MEQQRIVMTELGEIKYTLIRKKVKNLNLRIREDGSVVLCVPVRCTAQQADAMIESRCSWIRRHIASLSERAVLLPAENEAECRRRLEQAVERVFGLVEPYGVTRPELKIRTMRAQWGNCHWTKGYITLNRVLHRCPEYLQDYVALHELIHFLHHDHAAGFYGMMDALMPDWKVRRKELKRYAGALRE